jgi:hypothetical protein
VFIAGITDDKLFTGVNKTNNKLLPVSLLPTGDKSLLVSFTPDLHRFHDTGD